MPGFTFFYKKIMLHYNEQVFRNINTKQQRISKQVIFANVA